MSRPVVVTGAAGFIGSHLCDALLADGLDVIGLDDLSTGLRGNLPSDPRFTFVEGTILDERLVRDLVSGCGAVFHQAALGSVPRSIADPNATFRANVDGFRVVAEAVSRGGAGALVYASSSSVYGDSPILPRREPELGEPLSPYAASKRAGELWATALARTTGLPAVGLRYFNVVGPRQRADGAWAAVVPRWIAELRAGRSPVVYGGAHRSRDFTPVREVVRANRLAAERAGTLAGRVYNVGLGRPTALGELFRLLKDGLVARGSPCEALELREGPAREGDPMHGLADLTLAAAELGYRPTTGLPEALDELLDARTEPGRSAGSVPDPRTRRP